MKITPLILLVCTLALVMTESWSQSYAEPLITRNIEEGDSMVQNDPTQVWPEILSFETVVGIESGSRVYFEVPFKSTQGNTEYTLFGVGGSTEYLDQLSDETGINYVGPLMVTLVEGTENSEESLLSEDGSPPWHTRGMIRYEDLIGESTQHPEFGAFRHFKLRGFELTLQFFDIEIDSDDRVTFMKLKVSVNPSPDRTSPQV